MFSAFHLFFGLGIAWAKVIIFLPSPYSPFLPPWASWPLLLPCHSTMPAMALSSFCLHIFVMGSQSAHPFVNFLLKASQTHFSLLYLSWALLANIPAVPTHFITSFFGLPRSIYYLYYSRGLFTNSFGLLRPNYHIFISHCYLGLLALRLAH